MNQRVNLDKRISRLEELAEKQNTKLRALQQKRLIFGLGVFFLLIASQMFIGLHLEWAALLIFLPPFIFYFRLSKRQSRFIGSIKKLIAFYKTQQSIQAGQFMGQTRPEEMHSPDLARDLDLGVLFYNLNLCFTKEGENLLDSWLCQSFPNSSRSERQKRIQQVANCPGLIRRLQMNCPEKKINLSSIEKEVHRSFFENPMPWMWLIPIAWTSLIAFAILGLPSLFWKAALLTYIGTMLSFIGRTQHLFSRLQDIQQDFTSLSEKITVFEKLAELTDLGESLKQRQASGDVKKLNGLISVMSMKTNPILFYILNLIAPWDFALALLSEKARQGFYQHFKSWSHEIVQLEVYAAFANLAIYHNTQWAEESQNFIEATEVAHPLIDQSSIVKNDFNPRQNRVVIITGSNMSGKSTFLRALGINFCLANVGAPVFAKDFKFRPMNLVSCIRVSDSLRDGQSYFYAEVRRMKNILEKAQSSPVFFLIDEPLRGTNNRERLIGNQSYLKQILQTEACGFICTHDLELTKLADESDQITNYHFSEKWDDEDLRFDYKIKQGPSQSTNALKILAREGLYPKDL